MIKTGIINLCARFAHRNIIFPLACIIILAAGTGASAGAEVVKETIRSVKTGRTFMIYIYLPESYSSPGKDFPVLYLLDADKHFRQVARIVDAGIRQKRVRPLIITGIGYGTGRNFRKTDYTPTRIRGFDGSGGVEKFYGFIRHELIPLVDARYRTIPERKGRAIAGHSLGALAVFHGLFYHSDLFAGYMAASPALWWDRELFFRLRPEWIKQGQEKNLRVFTAAGSGEHRATQNYARRITRVLSENKNKGITAFYKNMPGMDHEGTAVPAIIAGIEKMFPANAEK